MQPTFLPWLGYFALIDRVDHFIYLDDVQFQRRSWQCRNRLKGPGGAVLLSLEVPTKPSRPLIRDTRLSASGFEARLMATARHLLARAPHGGMALAILAHGFATADGSLAALNIAIIEDICTRTGIATPRQRASGLDTPPLDKTQRLIALTTAVGGDTYLSPLGSRDYLTSEAPFAAAGQHLRFFNYAPAEYPQSYQPFLSHLSALDALAQVGPAGFLPLVRAGMRDDLALSDLPGAP